MLESLWTGSDLWSALATINWDLDPVAFKAGPLTFRYYGILFATGLMAGYGILRWQFRADGEDPDAAVRLTYGLIAGVILGARFGHVFFYEPQRYLANPGEILAFWKGGLASHGAALGMAVVVSIYIYGIRRIPFRVVADRMALGIPIATATVRIGNFFNSEIVGRATDLPWAVTFLRYDATPRHPSQLYEATGGFLVLGILLAVDAYYRKRKRERPLGLLVSLFLIGYFTMRFSVEFVKEYQTLEAGLTMGQYLSIPFFLAGVATLWATLWGPWKGQVASTYLEEEQARNAKKNIAPKVSAPKKEKRTKPSTDPTAPAGRSLARKRGRKDR